MSDLKEKGRLTRLRLALGMAVFGSATPVSKIVTGAMPVFVGSAFRVGLGALVLAPFAWSGRGALRGFTRHDWITVCLIALFGMFGFSALMLYGMGMVSGVVGAIVMSTAPAVTAAASMLFFGDSPTWRKLTAIALAVAGVLLLQLGQGSGSGGGSEVWLGAALVFGAVCCEACYTLLGKRMSEHADPVLVAFLASALSVPLFLPFAIWQWPDFDVAQVSAGAWAAAIWYGAGTLSLGTWLWYSGLAKAEGAVAAAFMGIMPVSALLLSYLLLGEEFRIVHLAGFGTVFAGVLLISWEHARMEKED
ncbi:DMT family transporter [Parvibaculum sp.]|uniref:DMT family transporter n=1 Tax=Parvibaculum sp. TaxID=2024848 RepID=UPI00391BEDB9